MNKSSTIWFIASLCVAIVLTALGIITYTVVQHDREQLRNFSDAYKQERIRMSMWRLDSLATSIVNAENERSAYEFKNPETQPIPQPYNTSSVNKLYTAPPKTVNLYFSFRPTKNSTVISPQVYSNHYLKENKIDTSFNGRNLTKLKQINVILESKPATANNEALPAYRDNREFTCMAAHVSLDSWRNGQEIVAKDNDDFSYSKAQLSQQELIDQITKPDIQKKLSIADKKSRRIAFKRIAPKNASNWNSKLPNSKKTPISSPEPKPSQNNLPSHPLIPSPSNIVEEPFSSPFLPIWLGNELVLVRKVTEPDGDSIQGVWLNLPVIKKMLLSQINDLFPNASLVPVKQDISKIFTNEQTADDITTLADLPLRLVVNESTAISINPKKYIFGPIGLAWLGALCALLASYFTLRSILNMAEKRASFISSVTHELRTPLTTFQLYSDLLASGMIQDKDKQQTYLETLKHEADRLTHIVENVLTYSAIEKGGPRAKVDDITITNLIERMQPRLAERATEENMLININLDPESALRTVHIDSTAVEQIIFNLVDNACKYANVDGTDKQIDIVVFARRKQLIIQVHDLGNGINWREKRRIFKPFHKSAHDAASSKPGVGLGLALCRRLARAMKGDLKLISSPKSAGTCFQLTLPINPPHQQRKS